MDESIYSWILSWCIVILYGLKVNAYQLKPIDLPKDIENLRIFTDVELAQYDASDVCSWDGIKHGTEQWNKM